MFAVREVRKTVEMIRIIPWHSSSCSVWYIYISYCIVLSCLVLCCVFVQSRKQKRFTLLFYDSISISISISTSTSTSCFRYGTTMICRLLVGDIIFLYFFSLVRTIISLSFSFSLHLSLSLSFYCFKLVYHYSFFVIFFIILLSLFLLLFLLSFWVIPDVVWYIHDVVFYLEVSADTSMVKS